MEIKQDKHLPHDTLSSDEMSLADLWKMLCAGWRLILTSLIFALATAGIYLAMTPRQYEATAIVKVGQTSVVGSVRGIGSIEDTTQVGITEFVQQIESTENTIARMQGAEFKNAVLESLGWKGGERERLFERSYQVTRISPTNRYLKVRLYGFSPDEAKQATEAAVFKLLEIHRELMATAIARRNQKFARVVADIADSEAYLRRIEPLGEGSRKDQDQTLRWLSAVKEENSRLRILRAQENLIKESMDPALNVPTMVAEQAAVSTQPVHPKVRRAWIFAVIGGILLGVLLVSLRSLARLNKENQALDHHR